MSHIAIEGGKMGLAKEGESTAGLDNGSMFLIEERKAVTSGSITVSFPIEMINFTKIIYKRRIFDISTSTIILSELEEMYQRGEGEELK